MKIPLPPPDLHALMQRASSAATPDRLFELLAVPVNPAPGGKYRHWDVLRHLDPPPDMDHQDWWLRLKLARRSLYRELPLADSNGRPFQYAPVDPLLRMVHQIDQQAAGALHAPELVSDSRTRDTYVFRSLVEEAITSSQLEGASTTHAVAKDMLQRGRTPRNRGERMIYNNFNAMQFIRSVADEPLSPALVFELHRIVTDQTLEDPSAAGRLRHADEPVNVLDELGNVLHVPPASHELEGRLEAVCALANSGSEESFLHPVVRAILLHFAVGYDHPFVDGNGRTARALFYWSMKRQGYWLCESLSISRIIRKAPSQYARAFLYTESDERDVTYFILHQLRTTVRAIRDLHTWLHQKADALSETRALVQRAVRVNAVLNHRQVALVHHALKRPGFVYTIASHQRAHDVSYQTARSDLLMLARLKLLRQARRGRVFVFEAPAELEARLAELAGRRSG